MRTIQYRSVKLERSTDHNTKCVYHTRCVWAPTQEPNQSSCRFSWAVGPGPWRFPETLNRTSAGRSWALGRMRQVKRLRSRRTGATLRHVPLQPTQSSQLNQRNMCVPRASRSSSLQRDVGHRRSRNSQGTNPRTGAVGKQLDERVTYVLRLRFALPGSVAAPNRRLLRQRQHSLVEDVAASLQPTVAAAAVFRCVRLPLAETAR